MRPGIYNILALILIRLLNEGLAELVPQVAALFSREYLPVKMKTSWRLLKPTVALVRGQAALIGWRSVSLIPTA
jgi:hypothetical protein